MSKYRDSLDDKGRADLDKLTALRESATKENTDPRVWAALQTPFRQPGDPRNPR